MEARHHPLGARMRRHLELARDPCLQGLQCFRRHGSYASKRYATMNPCPYDMPRWRTDCSSMQATTLGDIMPDTGWQVGIDIGGTFTDLVALLPATGEFRSIKVPTERNDPVSSIKAALAAAGL